MKAIKILDTDEKSGYIVLTNFMGWTSDKKDHILRIHRQFDGDDVFDNIQLKDNTFNIIRVWEIVGRLMEEFLADDDQLILDISEYVDQDVMMREDEEEEEDDEKPKGSCKPYIENCTGCRGEKCFEECGCNNGGICAYGEDEEEEDKKEEEEVRYYCAHCGVKINSPYYPGCIKGLGEKRYCSIRCYLAACNQDRLEAERELQEEEEEDAYIETLDLGEYMAWLAKTGKMESILKDLGRVAKCHKQEEDTRDDCGGYFSTRYFCPQCYKGKCNYIGECYGKGQRPY